MKNNSYKLSELISGKDAYYKQKTPLKIKKKFKLINLHFKMKTHLIIWHW